LGLIWVKKRLATATKHASLNPDGKRDPALDLGHARMSQSDIRDVRMILLHSSSGNDQRQKPARAPDYAVETLIGVNAV
jgi:hypothetical protein